MSDLFEDFKANVRVWYNRKDYARANGSDKRVDDDARDE